MMQCFSTAMVLLGDFDTFSNDLGKMSSYINLQFHLKITI
jgi:hypothetical protein